jgi:hypothetical protein
LVVEGGSVWLKPSHEALASLKFNPAELALVAGKWIKAKSTDSEVASLSGLCDFSGLLGSIEKPTSASVVATPATYEGQRVYEISKPGQQGVVYVTDSATPMLAELDIPAMGAAITFTAYGTASTITEPPAAETIDGSEFGF